MLSLTPTRERVGFHSLRVNTGIVEMITTLLDNGVEKHQLEAKIGGGSSILNICDGEPIGQQNVQQAHVVLDEQGIPVVAEDTGGDSARTIEFHTSTESMVVKSADGVENVL